MVCVCVCLFVCVGRHVRPNVVRVDWKRNFTATPSVQRSAVLVVQMLREREGGLCSLLVMLLVFDDRPVDLVLMSVAWRALCGGNFLGNRW